MPRHPADEPSYLTPILPKRAGLVKPEPRGGEQGPSTRRARPTAPTPRRSARTYSHRGRIPLGLPRLSVRLSPETGTGWACWPASGCGPPQPPNSHSTHLRPDNTSAVISDNSSETTLSSEPRQGLEVLLASALGKMKATHAVRTPRSTRLAQPRALFERRFDTHSDPLLADVETTRGKATPARLVALSTSLSGPAHTVPTAEDRAREAEEFVGLRKRDDY
jgi:hypothetical protein